MIIINTKQSSQKNCTREKVDLSPRCEQKPTLGQRSTLKKVEPAIWPHNTGQRISLFDSCQLNIVCMSN